MESETDIETKQKNTKCFLDNIEIVFNYLSSNTYPEGFSRDDKKQLRRKTKNFSIQDSVLYYNMNGMNIFTFKSFFFFYTEHVYKDNPSILSFFFKVPEIGLVKCNNLMPQSHYSLHFFCNKFLWSQRCSSHWSLTVIIVLHD